MGQGIASMTTVHEPAAGGGGAVRIERGDWLDLAKGLSPGSVDLLYADPPFNTGRTRATPPGASRAGRGVRAAYRDAWADPESYVAWLRERVRATLPAMKRTGGVLIHCDWRASHLVRVMLDGLLGGPCFVNHLVWSYGLGGSSPRMFARKHDDILFYAVSPGRHWFEPPRVPATSRRMAGRDKKATDVLAIPAINNMARERTGYPTQKPLALLRLLVGACCPPGGVVLDPCCGSGTTLVAALELGRRAIGFDQSPAAVRVARQRVGLAGRGLDGDHRGTRVRPVRPPASGVRPARG
jgi:site-specific DNA-methyltransferase (adenine-specific)